MLPLSLLYYRNIACPSKFLGESVRKSKVSSVEPHYIALFDRLAKWKTLIIHCANISNLQFAGIMLKAIIALTLIIKAEIGFHFRDVRRGIK